jgi:hypothetical protein
MAQKTVWTVVLEVDPDTGDQILLFAEDFLQQEDWRLGDVIRFDDVKRGSLRLTNVTKLEREPAARGDV